MIEHEPEEMVQLNGYKIPMFLRNENGYTLEVDIENDRFVVCDINGPMMGGSLIHGAYETEVGSAWDRLAREVGHEPDYTKTVEPFPFSITDDDDFDEPESQSSKQHKRREDEW